MGAAGLPARIDGRLLRGRAMAEARMADTFTAYAPNGFTTDADGFKVPAFTAKGTVRGYVQGVGRDTETTFVDVAGVRRPVVKGGLRIPMSAIVPTAGDRGRGWEYVCTAVGALSDMAMLGRRWLVWEVPVKSMATARRLTVVEVTDGRSGQ